MSALVATERCQQRVLGMVSVVYNGELYVDARAGRV